MTRGAAGGAERPARDGPRDFPRLVAITDLTLLGTADTLVRFERLAALARPGTVMLQLRDRESSARERLAFGRALVALCRRTSQLFQVNDRLDLAVLLGADAVHLGEGSMATVDARRVVGALWVTRACHEAERVNEVDADAVLLSPILAARKGRGPLGVEALRRASERLSGAGPGRARLLALGGVDAAGVRACLDAGADGVAVVGAGLSEGGAEGLVEALGIGRG